MSILEYNGSGIVVMTGKNCVAIASDLRFGVQQQTIAADMRKIFRLHPKLYVGLSGLATDMQTVIARLQYRTKMYELREERVMKPHVFGNLLAGMLYEKRFGPYFVEPIVCGLEDDEKTGEKDKPYICAMDLIGAPVTTPDFLVTGTASEQLYGVCEAMYKADMNEDELFETISQCLLAAVDRDCLSGWGAEVHIITSTHVTTRQLKSRKD